MWALFLVMIMQAAAQTRLSSLIAAINATECRPVEVHEVRDSLIKMGIQDKIFICADELMNPEHLRGAYCQYVERPSVYAPPVLVSVVVYCAQLSREWQRLVCVKELIHVLDRDIEKTGTCEEIEGLINRLLGPLSTEDFNLFDLMANKDRMALYQSLPILFPKKVRDIYKSNGNYTAEKVAQDLCIPVWASEMVLSDGWDQLAILLDC